MSPCLEPKLRQIVGRFDRFVLIPVDTKEQVECRYHDTSAMNFSLRLFSNVSVSVTRRIPAASGGKVSRSSAVQSVARSFSSTQPEKALCYEDFVKETLKKMVSERGTENLTREIADLDLERRFQHYDVSFRENVTGRCLRERLDVFNVL